MVMFWGLNLQFYILTVSIKKNQVVICKPVQLSKMKQYSNMP